MNTSPLPGSNELLYVGFNQDNACFACGTQSGFRIYNTDPFKETFRRDFKSGGIGHVEMLFRCNILALVGGGSNPRFPPNKVLIWDDHQNRSIGELSFRSDVKNVRLRRDRIAVVLESKIYVYNFADLKLIDHIETIPNPKGLCCLCPHEDSSVLVCPGLQEGHVRIELYDSKKPTTLISAHESALSCFSLNAEGTLLATASSKGTLIRVFECASGTMLQELRRGTDQADIISLCFSKDSRWLAASSDKGTVHVFRILSTERDREEAARLASDSTSIVSVGFNFVRGFLPSLNYFDPERSVARFRVKEICSIAAFGTEPNTLIVIGSSGSYYKASFDPIAGGECQMIARVTFIAAEDDE
jgi:WD40 repeat protein